MMKKEPQELFDMVSKLVYDDSKNVIDNLTKLLPEGEFNLRCIPMSGITMQLLDGEALISKANVRMFMSYNEKYGDRHGSMVFDIDVYIYADEHVEMHRRVDGAPRQWMVGYSDNFENYFLENFTHINELYRI